MTTPRLEALLCDRRANLLFYSASVAVLVSISLIGINVLLGVDDTQASSLLQLSLRIGSATIGILFVVSSLVIMIGMLAYFFGVDHNSWKLLWLLVFMISGSIGTAVYCLVAYRSQQAVRPRSYSERQSERG